MPSSSGMALSLRFSQTWSPTKSSFGFGMVHDVVYIVCLELVKDGDDYRTVGQCCEERYAPVGTVAATDGNLIAFLDAACLENDMQLFYFAGYVLIL